MSKKKIGVPRWRDLRPGDMLEWVHGNGWLVLGTAYEDNLVKLTLLLMWTSYDGGIDIIEVGHYIAKDKVSASYVIHPGER